MMTIGKNGRMTTGDTWRIKLEDDSDPTGMNIHDVNDIQSHKLGDGMFDEDAIFSPPTFDEKIYYDEVIHPIYDDYCDDIYAINNKYNHETCHHDFNYHMDYIKQVSHDSYFVEFAPTTMNDKNFACVGSNKNSMLVHHEK